MPVGPSFTVGAMAWPGVVHVAGLRIPGYVYGVMHVEAEVRGVSSGRSLWAGGHERHRERDSPVSPASRIVVVYSWELLSRR